MNQAPDSPQLQSSLPPPPHFCSQDPRSTGSHDKEQLQNFIQHWRSGIVHSELAKSRAATPDSPYPPPSPPGPVLLPLVARPQTSSFVPARAMVNGAQEFWFWETPLASTSSFTKQGGIYTEGQLCCARELAQGQFEADWTRMQNSWQRLEQICSLLRSTQRRHHTAPSASRNRLRNLPESPHLLLAGSPVCRPESAELDLSHSQSDVYSLSG